jgi:predicted RNA methylase
VVDEPEGVDVWHKLKMSLRTRGVVGTLRIATEYYLEPIAPYHPRRLAKRFADWRYDIRYHVETRNPVSLQELRPEDRYATSSSSPYQATSENVFREVLGSLALSYRDFVFIDFGSGKGKCLLMASDFPFKKIVGVEYFPELVKVARNNFSQYRSPRQKCRDLEAVSCDAAAYELPAEPAICYFYNPFGVDVMRGVCENIGRSLEKRPRRVYVVYYNAVHREVFDKAQWLTIIEDADEYCVYTNWAEAPEAHR